MNIRQIAINYIKNLNPVFKNNLKTMLYHGIICGSDYAKFNGVEPEKLTQELILIFKGE